MSVRQGYYGLVRQNGPWSLTPRDIQNINGPAPQSPSDFQAIRPYVSSSKPSSKPSKYAVRDIVYQPYIAASRGVKIPLGTLKRPQGVNLPPMIPDSIATQDFRMGPSDGPLTPEPYKVEPNLPGEEVKTEGAPEGAPEGGSPVQEVALQEVASPEEGSPSSLGAAANQIAQRAVESTVSVASNIRRAANTITAMTRSTAPVIGYMVDSGQLALEGGITALFGNTIATPIIDVMRTNDDIRRDFTRWFSDNAIRPLTEKARSQLGSVLENPAPYFAAAAAIGANYVGPGGPGSVSGPAYQMTPPMIGPSQGGPTGRPRRALPPAEGGTRTEYVPTSTEEFRMPEFAPMTPTRQQRISIRNVIMTALQYYPQAMQAGRLLGGTAGVAGAIGGAANTAGQMVVAQPNQQQLVNALITMFYHYNLRPLPHRVQRAFQ